MATTISPEQLQRLLLEHGAALRAFAAQWTGSPDDCVQEALLELVRQSAAPLNPVAWLFHVVRKRAISMSRAAGRRRKHEAAAKATAATWFLPAAMQETETQAVSQALAELAVEYREVIAAHIWGGLSFEQIGKLVGASTSTAHRRYEAGLRALRDRLKPYGREDHVRPVSS